MQFAFLGINYKNAQLDIREKAFFTDDRKIAFFQKAQQAGISQCMILSTCNRSEAYYFYQDEGQKESVRRIYEEVCPGEGIGAYLTERFGEEAVTYLFRIAAGLESLVLGEDQILGQVKEALDFSNTMGYGGKELNKIARDAVTCAKKVKTKFKISERPLSVSYIGIQKLKEACGISGKRILVIGSGKTAVLALQYLYEYPDVSIVACSRTYAHAARLREAFPPIAVIPYEKWRGLIGDFDAVVCATGAPHLIIRREDFSPVRPVVFLDLAAPRDIDPAFEADPLVTLINLDTLQEIAKLNQKERERLVGISQEFLETEAAETLLWLRQSRMDPTIASLQQRCDVIVEDGFSYLNRKMELGKREQKLLKKVLRASLFRLVREPILELKQLEGEEEQEEYKKLVSRLFRISDS